MTDRIFVGTELKFKIDIEAAGFSMADDNFTVDIVRGDKVQHFEKADLIQDEEDFYVCFDSAYFGTGIVRAVIYAYVPDNDFGDGLRTEVYQLDLIRIENVLVRRTPYGLIEG